MCLIQQSRKELQCFSAPNSNNILPIQNGLHMFVEPHSAVRNRFVRVVYAEHHRVGTYFTETEEKRGGGKVARSRDVNLRAKVVTD